MILTKENLKNISTKNLLKPDGGLFELPEKILQFGTGVLLRGLPDYFVDKANRQGVFNGRIVVVKSTGAGDSSAFEEQDGLYTLCVRGIDAGEKIEENIISSAISRVLIANTQWKEILQCAANPELQIIISNTTEVGIQLVKEDIHQQPPNSFPGKLLAFLYERFKAFNGSRESGMVIVPTELITDNGKILQSIVLELAKFNQLEEAFIQWLVENNHFCNSLVDRIVPGTPDADTLKQLQQELGYEDNLLIMSEAYRLWAIEGDEKISSVLSFAQINDGVVIAPDINTFKELKLRLLNGTHTLSCGLAFLAGFTTVKNAMDNEKFAAFLQSLMLNEIATSIPYQLPENAAQDFGLKVLDRFKNPFIQHQWISITMQYSSKMRMRNIPVLLEYYKTRNEAPENFSIGFAAYLLFMKAVKAEDGKYWGKLNDQFYRINDDKAAYFYEQWQKHTPDELADAVLQNQELWGTDLSLLNGFSNAVKKNLNILIKEGAEKILNRNPALV